MNEEEKGIHWRTTAKALHCGVEMLPDGKDIDYIVIEHIEYKDKENELVVHLRRPGLLIGKGGRTIDALAKQLDCKIGIVEVNLQK